MTIPPIGSLEALSALSPSAGPASKTGMEAEGAGTLGVEAGEKSTGSFGNALAHALNALESSQASGEVAAAEVATGSTSNPEAAIVKVQNAELEMQLASQMRAKASEALQTILQTQV
jgi:flagellar hook-basal body complex protein FliE